jgi:hypothetical protein
MNSGSTVQSAVIGVTVAKPGTCRRGVKFPFNHPIFTADFGKRQTHRLAWPRGLPRDEVKARYGSSKTFAAAEAALYWARLH